jgi:hypothetical protein
VLVEAHLRRGLLLVVVGAHPELEVSHVVGCQLDADFDDLVLLILAGDDAFAVDAAGLVGAGLQRGRRKEAF